MRRSVIASSSERMSTSAKESMRPEETSAVSRSIEARGSRRTFSFRNAMMRSARGSASPMIVVLSPGIELGMIPEELGAARRAGRLAGAALHEPHGRHEADEARRDADLAQDGAPDLPLDAL